MQHTAVTITGVLLAITGMASPVPARTTDDDPVEVLRTELAAMRFEYEARIADLERLAEAEQSVTAMSESRGLQSKHESLKTPGDEGAELLSALAEFDC